MGVEIDEFTHGIHAGLLAFVVKYVSWVDFLQDVQGARSRCCSFRGGGENVVRCVLLQYTKGLGYYTFARHQS